MAYSFDWGTSGGSSSSALPPPGGPPTFGKIPGPWWWYVGPPGIEPPPVTPKPQPQPVVTDETPRYKILAKDTFLPLVYGTAMVDCYAAVIHSDGSYLYVLYTICLGEISAISNYYFDNGDKDEPEKGLIAKGGAILSSYLGTSTQTYNTHLANLIPGYQDNLENVAYFVAKVPAAYTSIPRATVKIDGKLVYDYTTATTGFSTNPALWLADFITHDGDDYGQGAEIDEDSVKSAQAACDDTMSDGSVRRGGGFFKLVKQQRPEQVIDALRNLAGCMVTQDGFKYKLIPDRPVTSTTVSFNMNNILKLNKLEKLKQAKNPTAVKVIYTDTSRVPWTTKEVWATTSGVEAGTEVWRPQTVPLEGIVNASEAKRETIERINRYISDLSIDITVFDEALQLQVGDVFEVTHDIGLTSKQFQCLQDPVLVRPGIWRVTGIEYDDDIFSDEIISSPNYSDTTLPDPSDVPAVTGLSLTENLTQFGDGTFQTTITATWDAVDWPYVKAGGYQWKVESGGTLYFTGKVGDGDLSITTPPLTPLLSYNLSVRAYTPFFKGEWTVATITPQGKYAKPADVVTFSGYEVGGSVYLWWTKPNDPDIRRYEIRYYDTADTWADGTVIDLVDSLTLKTSIVPEGTWRFGIKAIDSVEQYSENPAEVDIEVTMDTDAFGISPEELSVDDASTTFVKIRIPELNDDLDVVGWVDKWVTAGDSTAAARFPHTMDTYTDPISSYCDNAGDCEVILDPRDYGQDYSGNFLVNRQVSALAGSYTEEQQLKTDSGSSYASYSSMSVKAKARYQKYYLKTSGTGNVACLTLPVSAQLSVIPRTEYGDSATSTTAADTISLDNDYSVVIDITLFAKSSTDGYILTYDNVDLNAGTFDVYAFDTDNNRVAIDYHWKFKGA